jgi:hypothetical protein
MGACKINMMQDVGRCIAMMQNLLSPIMDLVSFVTDFSMHCLASAATYWTELILVILLT